MYHQIVSTPKTPAVNNANICIFVKRNVNRSDTCVHSLYLIPSKIYLEGEGFFNIWLKLFNKRLIYKNSSACGHIHVQIFRVIKQYYNWLNYNMKFLTVLMSYNAYSSTSGEEKLPTWPKNQTYLLNCHFFS